MKKFLKFIIKNILKVFYIFPIRKKDIFILSFYGDERFAFDGKAIVDYSNNNNLGFHFFWGTNKKVSNAHIKNLEYVKFKNIKGIFKMITSSVMITNINSPSFIPFRKKQIIINTWHGLPIKKVGKYVPGYNYKQVNTATCFTSHCLLYTNIILKDSFNFCGDILNCGCPRNDIFFQKENKKIIKKVKNKYGLSKEKILLYAPTFRNDFKESKEKFEYKELIEFLNNITNEKWVIMKRLHPLIVQREKGKNKNVIDVTDYPDPQELMYSADILITDYSSMAFDFALTKKLVLLYFFDYDEFLNNRGLNDMAINRPFPIAKTQKEIYKILKSFDYKKYIKELDKYFEEIKLYEKGNSCNEIFKYIFKKLGE